MFTLEGNCAAVRISHARVRGGAGHAGRETVEGRPIDLSNWTKPGIVIHSFLFIYSRLWTSHGGTLHMQLLSIVGASYVRLDATWYALWYGKQPCILLWEAIFWGCPHAVRREVEKRHVGLARVAAKPTRHFCNQTMTRNSNLLITEVSLAVREVKILL